LLIFYHREIHIQDILYTSIWFSKYWKPQENEYQKSSGCRKENCMNIWGAIIVYSQRILFR